MGIKLEEAIEIAKQKLRDSNDSYYEAKKEPNPDIFTERLGKEIEALEVLIKNSESLQRAESELPERDDFESCFCAVKEYQKKVAPIVAKKNELIEYLEKVVHKDTEIFNSLKTKNNDLEEKLGRVNVENIKRLCVKFSRNNGDYIPDYCYGRFATAIEQMIMGEK